MRGATADAGCMCTDELSHQQAGKIADCQTWYELRPCRYGLVSEHKPGLAYACMEPLCQNIICGQEECRCILKAV